MAAEEVGRRRGGRQEHEIAFQVGGHYAPDIPCACLAIARARPAICAIIARNLRNRIKGPEQISGERVETPDRSILEARRAVVADRRAHHHDTVDDGWRRSDGIFPFAHPGLSLYGGVWRKSWLSQRNNVALRQ